jgi:DNA-binding transcriptional LysR family regulator
MLPAELEDSLEAGKIDIAFMRSVNRSIRRFPALWLEGEEMVAMIPKHMDPCPKSDSISVDKLKDLAFCGGIDKHYRESRNWDFGEMLEKELSEKGEEFARIYECSGAIASMILSANGLAVSLVPEKTARSMDSRNLNIKHVEDTEMYTWPAVAWNDDVASSYQVDLFVKFISDDVRKQ